MSCEAGVDVSEKREIACPSRDRPVHSICQRKGSGSVRKTFRPQAVLSPSRSDLDNKKKIFGPEICFISGL